MSDYAFSKSELLQILDVVEAMDEQIEKYTNGGYGDAPDVVHTIVDIYKPRSNQRIGQVYAKDDRAYFDPHVG